jgi:exosortase/archaeosortase family protein
MWGFAIIIAGLVIYAGAVWPLSFGYMRNMAMVPVFAGIVLITCGWRFLKLSSPMLLLLILSIPFSSGLNVRLKMRPETYTIAMTARVLDQLPGTNTSIEGKDLFLSSNRGSGVIALGQSQRGVRLLFAYSMIGVFVVFSKIRTRWRILIALIAAIPIALFCNLLRFISWGLVIIYTRAEPLNALPRNISAFLSLFAAYGLFLFVCNARINLFVEVNEQVNNDNNHV